LKKGYSSAGCGGDSQSHFWFIREEEDETMLKQIAIAAAAGTAMASQAMANSINLTGIVDGQAPIALVNGNDAAYGNVPNGQDTSTVTLGTFEGNFPLATAETPTNADFWSGGNCSNCGDVVTGQYIATQSGFVQFAEASDDASALYVNGVQVAGANNSWTGSRNYNELTNAQATDNFSPLIAVTAGESFNIEGIHGQGGGGQNYAITASYIVPEPASLGLLGLCGLGLFRRCRRA
jgi:hypothetical protein